MKEILARTSGLSSSRAVGVRADSAIIVFFTHRFVRFLRHRTLVGSPNPFGLQAVQSASASSDLERSLSTSQQHSTRIYPVAALFSHTFSTIEPTHPGGESVVEEPV